MRTVRTALLWRSIRTHCATDGYKKLQERRLSPYGRRWDDLPVHASPHDSGRPPALLAENIGTQLFAGNSAFSAVFDRWPPLRFEKCLGGQPIRDSALPERRALHERRDAFRQRDLAPATVFDSVPECANVGRFTRVVRLPGGCDVLEFSLHRLRDYQHTHAQCNEYAEVNANVTAYESTDTVSRLGLPAVIEMATEKRQKEPFPVGPDGKTANQRLRDVLASHATIRTQAVLLEECRRIAQGVPGVAPGQTSITNYINDRDNLQKGSYAGIIADALGIRTVWLQYGIGLPTTVRAGGSVLDQLLAELQQRTHK